MGQGVFGSRRIISETVAAGTGCSRSGKVAGPARRYLRRLHYGQASVRAGIVIIPGGLPARFATYERNFEHRKPVAVISVEFL